MQVGITFQNGVFHNLLWMGIGPGSLILIHTNTIITLRTLKFQSILNLEKKLKKAKTQNEALIQFLQQQNGVEICTDGSNSSESMAVGIACICPELNVEVAKSVNKIILVFTAECIDVSTAIDLAIQHSNKISDPLGFIECIDSLKSCNLNLQ